MKELTILNRFRACERIDHFKQVQSMCAREQGEKMESPICSVGRPLSLLVGWSDFVSWSVKKLNSIIVAVHCFEQTNCGLLSIFVFICVDDYMVLFTL